MLLARGTTQPSIGPAAQGCTAPSPVPPAQVQRFSPPEPPVVQAGLRFTPSQEPREKPEQSSAHPLPPPYLLRQKGYNLGTDGTQSLDNLCLKEEVGITTDGRAEPGPIPSSREESSQASCRCTQPLRRR